MKSIDDVIENIEDKQILNISFREYIIIFDDFYLEVYPFAYNAYRYKKIKSVHFNSSTHKYYGEREKLFTENKHHCHQNEFIVGNLKYSPCQIFEDVSGYKIHSENEIEYDLRDKSVCVKWDKKYQTNYNIFHDISNKHQRKQKLKRILDAK